VRGRSASAQVYLLWQINSRHQREVARLQLATLGPGAAGGIPFSRAKRRMYAAVNGDRRSTSVGVTPAFNAVKTALMAANLAFS
jgi:hypothetical protein